MGEEDYVDKYGKIWELALPKKDFKKDYEKEKIHDYYEKTAPDYDWIRQAVEQLEETKNKKTTSLKIKGITEEEFLEVIQRRIRKVLLDKAGFTEEDADAIIKEVMESISEPGP